MVTRKQNSEKKKGKVKVLNLNKETIKDLPDAEAKQIKGGVTILGSRQSRASGFSGIPSGATNGCSNPPDLGFPQSGF